MCIGFVTSLLPEMLYAQDASAFTSADVSVKLNPKTPRPGDTVTISLESFIRDVNVATIAWSVNGVQRLAGIGKNTFVVAVGAGGTITDIVVTATWNDGVSIVRRLRINPVDIDILWQATDSYVPAGYRGKALPAAEGEVRFVALPQNTSGNSLDKGYTYTWRRNGSVVQDASGYEKNGFLMKNNFFDTNFNVGVTATSRDGSYRAEKTFTLSRFDPRIIFQVDEFPLPPRLVGSGKSVVLPSKADGKTRLLTVIPLFFSAPTTLANTYFSWKFNERDFAAQFADRPYERIITSPDTLFNPGTLTVQATSDKYLLQEASGNVRIEKR